LREDQFQEFVFSCYLLVKVLGSALAVEAGALFFLSLLALRHSLSKGGNQREETKKSALSAKKHIKRRRKSLSIVRKTVTLHPLSERWQQF